jgi:subtilisin-like proprotein convertase family protein
VANSDNRQFDVVFPQQSAPGTYTLQIGTGIKDLAGNLLNQDGDSVNGEAGQDGCAATFVIQPVLTFTSTTKVSIRDLTKNIATMTIGSDVYIADINVRIDLKHTFDNDLYIHLIGPDGTDVVLANRRGGTADNYTNTLFDDEATKSISAGTAPFNGAFRPETVLSAFDGKNARGTWQLVIEDRQAGDSGTLNSWSLIIENGTAPSAQTNPPGSATLNTFSIEGDGQGANERTGPAPGTAIEGPFMLPPGERAGETVQPVETHGEHADVRSLEARLVDLAFTRVQPSTLAWSSVRQDAPPALEDLVEFFKRFDRR